MPIPVRKARRGLPDRQAERVRKAREESKAQKVTPVKVSLEGCGPPRMKG